MTITSSNPKLITQAKGDFAMLKIAIDLKQKGYLVFKEIVSECLPYDLLAFKDGIYYRIQCKYSVNLTCPKRRINCNTKSVKILEYSENEIDFFGLYHPDTDKVFYVHVSKKGIILRIDPICYKKFWLASDFCFLTNDQKIKSLNDFSLEEQEKARLTRQSRLSILPSRKRREFLKKNPTNILKGQKIDLNLLQKEILEIPFFILCKKYNVSDVGLKKFAKKHNLICPSRSERLKAFVKSKQSLASGAGISPAQTVLETVSPFLALPDKDY